MAKPVDQESRGKMKKKLVIAGGGHAQVFLYHRGHLGAADSIGRVEVKNAIDQLK